MAELVLRKLMQLWSVKTIFDFQVIERITTFLEIQRPSVKVA